jgi:hypothetical protein
MAKIETIQPFSVAPWEKRIHIIVNPVRQEAAQIARDAQGILVAACASEKKGVVGIGSATYDTRATAPPDTTTIASYQATLGPRDRFNIYFAEFIAVAITLQNLASLPLKNRVIVILSSNLSLLQAINSPRQQSAQSYLCQIYKSTYKLKKTGNQVVAIWAPANEQIFLRENAKATARRAAQASPTENHQTPSAKATVLCLAKRKYQGQPIERVGEYIMKFDTALPGKHTRLLYNQLNRTEAYVLAQLRTGMSRLNGYLYHITAANTAQCACGQAKETVEHFLFRCNQWDQYRQAMLRHTATKQGSLSFFLGGKAASDSSLWRPNLSAVRATIQYAIATGRLAFDTTLL